MLKSTIFREYDIRGIADDDLLSPGIQLLGQAVGTYIQRRYGRKVNAGRDVRLSGERLRDAFVAGLVASGWGGTGVGRGPTPPLFFFLGPYRGPRGGKIPSEHHTPG